MIHAHSSINYLPPNISLLLLLLTPKEPLEDRLDRGVFGINLDGSSILRPATHIGMFQGGPLDHIKELEGKGVLLVFDVVAEGVISASVGYPLLLLLLLLFFLLVFLLLFLMGAAIRHDLKGTNFS